MCAKSNSLDQADDDAVISLAINRSSFHRLLFDAAGAILKFLYPKLFHVTCIAHLLHSCTMKVKSHFENVDQLITKVKSATVKTKPDKPDLLQLVVCTRIISANLFGLFSYT